MKTLALGIVVLFIGVSFQPIMATNSFQDEKSDLVKVDVQICGFNGGQNYTKYLTQEQVQQLKDLFDTIYNMLDNSKNSEETIEVFKDAVVSIDALGLLPEDMTVEEAQKLVIGGEQNPKVMKLLEKWYDNHRTSLDDNGNLFCYMAGDTTTTSFAGLSYRILFNRLMFFPELYLIMSMNLFAFLFWSFFPLHFGYEIGLGSLFQWGHYSGYYISARGQIHTNGIYGSKLWNGSFYGNIRTVPPIFWFLDRYLVGVLGFTGIKIYSMVDASYYIGFAKVVKISYDAPEF